MSFEVGQRVLINVSEMKSRSGIITSVSKSSQMVRVNFGEGSEWTYGFDEISLDSNTTKDTGTKHDHDKPDLSLLPRVSKEGIAKAFMDGEKKYGRYNYLNGMDWTRLLAAAERHLSAFNDGEDCAQDSGLNHLYHAGANIMMLIEYFEKELGNDNRKKM